MNERYDRLLSGLTLDAGEGPARRLTPSAMDTQISAIMSQVLSAPPRAEPPVASLPALAARPVRRLSAAKVAILVAVGLVTGSAAAMVARQVVRWSAEPPQLSSVAPPPTPPERQVRVEEPAPVVEVRAEEPAPIAPVELEAIDTTADAEVATRSTADLMALANRQRGAGRYRAAERTYLSMLAADGAGPAAHVAAVAAAAIRLEHLGDPRGALALYRRALRIQPDGPLLVECYEGLARAHRELGDVEAEARALTALVGSGYAGPARARALSRLKALSQAPDETELDHP